MCYYLNVKFQGQRVKYSNKLYHLDNRIFKNKIYFINGTNTQLCLYLHTKTHTHSVVFLSLSLFEGLPRLPTHLKFSLSFVSPRPVQLSLQIPLVMACATPMSQGFYDMGCRPLLNLHSHYIHPSCMDQMSGYMLLLYIRILQSAFLYANITCRNSDDQPVRQISRN